MTNVLSGEVWNPGASAHLPINREVFGTRSMQALYLSILDSAAYFINHSCVKNTIANNEFVEGEG
jgi:hypothetical protein